MLISGQRATDNFSIVTNQQYVKSSASFYLVIHRTVKIGEI